MAAVIQQELELFLSSNTRFIEELEIGMSRITMESYIADQSEFLRNNSKFIEELETEMIDLHLETKTHHVVSRDDGEEADICSICHGDFEEGDSVGVLDCRHEFHTGCIKTWLLIKNLCPLCKSLGVRYRC